MALEDEHIADNANDTQPSQDNSNVGDGVAISPGIGRDISPFPSTLNEADDLNPIPSYPNPIILDIGGRTFKVSLITLYESGLFQHQLSDRYTWTPQADGSYFLDADPDLFEHLLRFMRRPEVFPLFYTKGSGFDYNLYNSLEAEAEYFQIDALKDWIKEKQYEKAVVVHTTATPAMEPDKMVPRRDPAHVEETWHVIPRIRKVYVCPRGIVVHRGDPDRCGQACRKARGDEDIEYDEETYEEVVIVKKEIEFVAGVCKVE